MNRRLSVLSGAVLGGVLLLSAAMGVRAYGLKQSVPSDFTVGGKPVGGMSLPDVIGMLKLETNRLNAQSVEFESDYEPAAGRKGSFQELGLRWDWSAAESALQKLGSGSAMSRALQRWKLRGREYAPQLRLDGTVYHQHVEKAWAELHASKPTPARRIITGKDQVEIIPDVAAYRVDEKALETRILQADWLRVWHNDATADPKAGLDPVRVALPLTETKADVTSESLAGQGIDRKIVEFETAIVPGDPGRWHNIASAAKSVHDRLLAPGEIFDYAAVVKETEARYGFREAPVIFNGKLVPGIGGGICQVSSTLYNAVLRAGLEIVERRNHSLPVSYVPLGQDATYSDGYINFRFRNNTGAHLLIRTETGKDRLAVKLFGRMPNTVSYRIESITVEELAAPVKTVVNPALKPGQRETLQKGKAGYVVETYRTKIESNTILSKELISKDRYLPQPTLVAVSGQADGGTAPESPGNVLEDGISGPRFR